MDNRIAGVQVYFNFLEEADRVAVTLQAYQEMRKSGVRLLTVEVVLEGTQPALPLQDKLVVTVRHPAWYKVAGINFGARHLIREGYKYIAWFDADSFVTPAQWQDAAVEALQRHKLIQLGDTLIEYDTGAPRRHATIAACYHEPVLGESSIHDGGGWAARADLFTSGPGLWPYSMVEGGNKVLLYPFIKQQMESHPLILATRGTDVGRSLEEYWKAFEVWNEGLPLGVLANHSLTLLPHGSQDGRGVVWAVRYGFYRQLSITKDVVLTPEGFPQIEDERLRSLIMVVLRERINPSPRPVKKEG